MARIKAPGRSIRPLAIGAGVAAIILGALLMVIADRWSLSRAEAAAQSAALSRALANRSLLSSELQKFRLLPLVLADYPDVQAALDDRSPASIARLNARLELIAQRTDAAVIYVITRDGQTIAACLKRVSSATSDSSIRAPASA